MKTSLKRLGPILLGIALGTGCSLIVNFDPEGQPCDQDQRCLDGYGCVAGKCMKGADAGSSPCGNCAAGFKCLESSRACVPNTCQYTRCVVGSICVEDTGTPFCRPVQAPAIGHTCVEDVDCATGGANRFCLRGAIQNNDQTGSLRTGLCVERCPQFGGSCLTQGSTCRDFTLAVDGGVSKLCVPDNLLVSCRTDGDCLDPAFVCTVFDNPNLAPLTVCDQALSVGAQPSQACSASKADGGTSPYCANGLCLPQDPIAAQQPVCAVTCAQGGCGTGVCALAEFTVRGVPRHIPACVPAVSYCQSCVDNSNCNADAPRCSGFGLAVNDRRCLSACSASPGLGSSCPPGQKCQQLDAGLRCVPQNGFCP